MVGPQPTALKESAEERRRFIRDADDLVRCLTIEFEIELGLGSTVVPVGKKFEFASPQASLRERRSGDEAKRLQRRVDGRQQVGTLASDLLAEAAPEKNASRSAKRMLFNRFNFAP